MIITPLSKGSRIPREEKSTAEILESLPDNWLCICGDKDTYFSFLKDNKKLRGTQIDFVVISEYGMFFLESKNVSLIKSDHNNIIFESQNKEEYNPLYRAIEYPNLAKNWFLEVFRKSKIANHLYKKSDLRFGIWGTVVITNDNFRIVSPQKELKLKDITHHKQLNIIHRSELIPSFFKKFYNIKKAPHTELLTEDDIFLLFNIMMHQNIDADNVFTPDTKRVYQMLKYVNKYKINTQNLTKRNEENKRNIIEQIKEEKEEIKTNNTVLKQRLEELKEEHKVDLERLNDQKTLIETLERKKKEIEKEKEDIIEKNKTQKNLINTAYNIIDNALYSIIGLKNKKKNEANQLLKKIKGLKNIRILNFVLIGICIFSIVSIIILSFNLSKEITKIPPTPSDIFFESYNEIKVLFKNGDYQELINHYKNLDYTFEFLSSDQVTLYNYYLGYSYFVTGSDNSSTKNTGVKILSNLNINQLSIDQILRTYKDVFFYLKENKRYNDAGAVLGKIEKVVKNRENELKKTDEGVFKLLNTKLFFIKTVSTIDESNIDEFSIFSYLYLGALGMKNSILDFYIEDIYDMIQEKINSLMEKIDKSNGLYRSSEASKIMDIYKRYLDFIKKIEKDEYPNYELKENSFTQLKIRINVELGRLYLGNKKYHKAIELLETARDSYQQVKELYSNNTEKLPLYLEMFMFTGLAYNNIHNLCNAYEAYWYAIKIGKKLYEKTGQHHQTLVIAEATADTLKVQIKEIIGECNFESEEINKSLNE